EHRDHIDVRRGEGGADRRVLEQRHPGHERAEVPGDGHINPRRERGGFQPTRGEGEFSRALRGQLERDLREGVERGESSEAEEIETRHARPPASTTPTAIKAKPAMRIPSSRSRKTIRPARATVTMLIEPRRMACESGMSESSASQRTNSRTKQRMPA